MQIHLKPFYCLAGSQLQQLTRNISPDPAVRYARRWEQPGFVPTHDVEFLYDTPQPSRITEVRDQDVVLGPACDRCATTGWRVEINPDADQKNWLTCIGKSCEPDNGELSVVGPTRQTARRFACQRRLMLPVEWSVVG